MFPIVVILFTSCLASVVIWFATGGLSPDGGNLVAGVLAAIAVALLWSRDFMALERIYLDGRLDRLRKKLVFWRASLGPEETLLLRLSAAIEALDTDEVDRCRLDAQSIGLDSFVRAWSAGMIKRLGGDLRAAIAEFMAGARETVGLDRAELLLVAQLTHLQACYTRPGEFQLDDAIGQALRSSNQVGILLRDSSVQRFDRARRQYVEVLHHGLRGMIALAQGRIQEGVRKLDEAIHRARLIRSVRARHLAQLFELERLIAIHASSGPEAFHREFAAIRSRIRLSSLRQRADELSAWHEKITQNEGQLDASVTLRSTGTLDRLENGLVFPQAAVAEPLGNESKETGIPMDELYLTSDALSQLEMPLKSDPSASDSSV